MKRTGWQMQKGALALLALFSLSVNAQQLVDVRIENSRFDPAEISIRVGDLVRWTNHEKRTSHSVILPIAGVAESDRMLPEESWAYRFEQAGRYEYHCGPHPEMKGVIRVGD